MFKKIYIEITNNCNLNCSFCAHNKRPNKFMSVEEFGIILSKLKSYTKHLYLHVLGEPLLHPNIIKMINLASQDFNINITTNGYLIHKIDTCENIRQINISLHSFQETNNIPLEEYLSNIFDLASKLSRKTYINYRLWIKGPCNEKILEYINREYKTKLVMDHINANNTLASNIFLSTHKEFVWPSLNNDVVSNKGTCYALRDHIAILVDGTVVPCCLDADGIMPLGNIFSENLEDIIQSDKFQRMLKDFKDNKKCELLCQRCHFIDK